MIVRDQIAVAKARSRLTGESLKFLSADRHTNANTLVPTQAQADLEALLIWEDPTASDSPLRVIGRTYITASANEANGRAIVVTSWANAFRRWAMVGELPNSSAMQIATPLGTATAEFRNDARSADNPYVVLRGAADSLVVIIDGWTPKLRSRVALAGKVLQRVRGAEQQRPSTPNDVASHRASFLLSVAIRHFGIKESLLRNVIVSRLSESRYRIRWEDPAPPRSLMYRSAREDATLALTCLSDSSHSTPRLEFATTGVHAVLTDRQTETELELAMPWQLTDEQAPGGVTA